MGATTRYGLRWPANTAPATIWTYIRNLAEDVEGRLATVEDSTSRTAVTPQLSADSAPAAWDSGTAFAHRYGAGLVTLEGRLTTGAQVGLNGAAVVVTNVPAPYYGSGTSLPIGSFVYGTMPCFGVWNGTSSCWFLYDRLAAAIVGPVPAATSFQLHATYREA